MPDLDTDSRVFVSTACLTNTETLSNRLSAYHDAGLEAVELGAGVEVGPDDMDYLAHTEGPYLIHNYFPPPKDAFAINLADQDSLILQKSLALCQQAIDLSARLGAPFYSVHAGFRASLSPESLGAPLRYDEIVSYDQAYQTYVESLQELAIFADDLGVAIIVEPNVLAPFNLVQGRNELALFCEAWEIANLMRDVSGPPIGILLDTGHLNVTSRTLGYDRVDFIDHIAPYIRAFHVHDNDRTVDSHLPVHPDSWVLDILRRQVFSGLPIVIEAKFDSLSALHKHANWLRGALNHV